MLQLFRTLETRAWLKKISANHAIQLQKSVNTSRRVKAQEWVRGSLTKGQNGSPLPYISKKIIKHPLFFLITTGIVFAIKVPFSKMKSERKKGSTWEEDRTPDYRSHLYSEKAIYLAKQPFRTLTQQCSRSSTFVISETSRMIQRSHDQWPGHN